VSITQLLPHPKERLPALAIQAGQERQSIFRVIKMQGSRIFVTYCQVCHGQEGAGGVLNPGSTDGTIPPLNPIDPTLVNPDYKTFAYNLDLFIQNGSIPAGDSPVNQMPAWGRQRSYPNSKLLM